MHKHVGKWNSLQRVQNTNSGKLAAAAAVAVAAEQQYAAAKSAAAVTELVAEAEAASGS